VQAQTLANLELAQAQGLTILPVINKIDLPEARPEEVALEIAEIINYNPDDVMFISAKTGEGVRELLDAIVEKIPSPRESVCEYPRALVFDSYFDDYR
jgi:GTP-binding protein LepA